MSATPWFPWYSADYRRKTAHLTFTESEAYRRLLEHYYEQAWPIGKGIVSDRPGLWRICAAQTEEEKAAINRAANEFFYLNDNMLHHKAADEIMTKMEEKKNALSAAGHRGGLLGGRGRSRPSLIGQVQAKSHSQSEQSTALEPVLSSSPSVLNKENTKAKSKFELPDWIPAEQWNAWVETRAKSKHPLNDWSKHLAVVKLEHLKAAGHLPAGILANAAFHCWRGLWPPKS